MERNASKYLQNWNTSKRRKPLMIWGARQVGKTYLVKDLFAEKYYKDNYIYVDFKENRNIRDQLKNRTSPKEIMEYLSLQFRKQINKDTLLIFDEVQDCSSIITSLKYFCQDYREIPVIATGSLVRIKLKTKPEDDEDEVLFPVGKIDELYIYPLTFDEYLQNENAVMYKFLLDHYKNGEQLDSSIHELILNEFYRYILIGGMPEVVDNYIEDHNLLSSINTLQTLYNNYISDMSTYQKNTDSTLKTIDLYNNIYKELNKDSKNFSPGLLEHGSKTRDYYTPIEWLVLANIINKSHQLKEHVTTPLSEQDKTDFRLYLADMGLFTYQSGISATSFLSKDIQNTLSGIFYENFVACELIARGLKLFYWKGKKSNEMEFIIHSNDRLIPIDVKKGRSGLNSLETFANHNKYDFAIKISINNCGYDPKKRLLTIPFYFTPFLADDLKAGKDIPFIK